MTLNPRNRTLAFAALVALASTACVDALEESTSLSDLPLDEGYVTTDQLDEFEMIQQGLDVLPGRSLCVNRGFSDEQIFEVPEGGAPFYGTAGPDCILGTAGPDVIYGLGGNDVIFAGGGGNFVDGGDGNDEIWGGEGDDELRGRAGDDVIYGRAGNDFLYGGSGNDIIYGQDGDDFLYGQDGDDLLYGGNGNDYINGGNGNDRLLGEGGNDELWSGEGITADNFLYGGPGDDLLVGGLNQSTRMAGQDGVDTLRGRTGNNLMIGGGPGNLLFPGPGNSVFILDPTDRVSSIRITTGTYACNRPTFCILPEPPTLPIDRVANLPPGFCDPGSEYTRPISACIFCRADAECDDGDPGTTDYCLPTVGCQNDVTP